MLNKNIMKSKKKKTYGFSSGFSKMIKYYVKWRPRAFYVFF